MTDNHIINLMLIGHQKSGKSQIAEVYISEKPKQNNEYLETNAVLFFQKIQQLDKVQKNLVIADTPGIESDLFKSIIPLMIQGQHIIILVFDLCNYLSLKFEKEVIDLLKKQDSKTYCIIGTQKLQYQDTDKDYKKQVTQKIEKLKQGLEISQKDAVIYVDGQNFLSVQKAIQMCLNCYDNRDQKFQVRKQNTHEKSIECQLI
ncbi:hypothetical protein ABPG72_002189 [Tetrahymena utriculariae]